MTMGEGGHNPLGLRKVRECDMSVRSSSFMHDISSMFLTLITSCVPKCKFDMLAIDLNICDIVLEHCWDVDLKTSIKLVC